MKRNSLPTFVGAAALALSLAALPSLSASAQTAAPGGTGTTDTTGNPQTNQAGDRDFDWGWLGLLGLAGLAGLARRNDEPAVRYRDPNETTNPTSRY
jgi:MYXO-CTERM domain-containing protein